ncbi:hypothetical protein HW130_34920 [Streptomyces sp. PKU-EA00015]|uniref:hypothetical protein n=1 Tax=Streptomyces sp. PKU-EA00015 TaxID=2748326 RepID=UPI0015A2B9FD|nr:hypothetical protein [Streptomyces sp. PKU-EA00015]NWF31349.1 hypothetical protein [Streptomyces sp. PKU-EA00015]
MTSEAVPAVLRQTRSYFLAGTMQGARTGADLTDQSYRQLLTRSLLDRRPDAVIHDPGTVMAEWLASHPADVRAAHAALADRPVVRHAELAPELRELTDLFHQLTRLAAASDVCVAWLPGHEPSMGTAAEMLSAYRAGRTVVSITDMRQNLAVLSCSTVILPDLDAFTDWLDAGGDTV